MDLTATALLVLFRASPAAVAEAATEHVMDGFAVGLDSNSTAGTDKGLGQVGQQQQERC